MSLVILAALMSIGAAAEYVCDRDIYCHGELLNTVQMAKIFNDSKYFVDMPMKWASFLIRKDFDDLMRNTQGRPDNEQLKTFVNRHFSEAGTDSYHSKLEDVADWKEDVDFLNKIKDVELRRWASELHRFWNNLTLHMIDDVRNNPQKYSLIYLPKPMIVPGDRFRELFYWDSFWTIKGLLTSEMHDSVKGMLENFLSLVDRYGFVLNGARVYFTRRSQPPFLIPMMNDYLEATQDLDFLRNSIDMLEKEYQFWMTNRTMNVTLNGKTYTMNRYNVEAEGPRPESYYEDVETAKWEDSEEDRQEVYKELKTAAESGWDFSTRWIINNGTNKGGLRYSKPRSIIPVDLNSILCKNAKYLSSFYNTLGRVDKAEHYSKEASRIEEAIYKVLWDEQVGSWLDYDLINKKRRNYFYMSNMNPLWSGCYQNMEDKETMIKKVLKYLKKEKTIQYPKGVPTSLIDSSQQWDYPNAWAPLQHLLIEGLAKLDNQEANDLAYELAQRWISTNYQTYTRTGYMFEKYNVITGKGGSGGEYDVQLGFGWSNGVVLDLLGRYGDRLSSSGSMSASYMCIISLSMFVWITVS